MFLVEFLSVKICEICGLNFILIDEKIEKVVSGCIV